MNLSLSLYFKMGRDFAKQSFWMVFPIAFLMSVLGYALQPNTFSTFSEWMDWIAIAILGLGVFALSALHASLLIQMNAVIHGRGFSLKQVLQLGLQKSLGVFCIGLLYSGLVIASFLVFRKIAQIDELASHTLLLLGLKLVLWILPAVWLAVYFYLALFIAVLLEHKQEVSLYQTLWDYGRESILLLRGHWWQMLGLLLLMSAAMLLIEGLYQLLVKEWVVPAIILSVLARACILPFWYGSVLALILERKAKRVEDQDNLESQPPVLKENGAS